MREGAGKEMKGSEYAWRFVGECVLVGAEHSGAFQSRTLDTSEFSLRRLIAGSVKGGR